MFSEMGSWRRGCGSELLGWNRSMARSTIAEEIHEHATGGGSSESTRRRWIMRITTLELLIHNIGGGSWRKKKDQVLM
jgi:hypothetical protein